MCQSFHHQADRHNRVATCCSHACFQTPPLLIFQVPVRQIEISAHARTLQEIPRDSLPRAQECAQYPAASYSKSYYLYAVLPKSFHLSFQNHSDPQLFAFLFYLLNYFYRIIFKK